MSETIDHYSDDFYIGDFGDNRLGKVGTKLFEQICKCCTVCIKRLAGKRSLEVAFGRFLGNRRVKTEVISNEFATKTNEACVGKEHVLCIQDTVQLTYPTQETKKAQFGPTGDSDTKGLFVHPGLIVDAENKDILGMSSILTWCRDEEQGEKSRHRPIEEKESIRWLDTAMSAKKSIGCSSFLTTVFANKNSEIRDL